MEIKQKFERVKQKMKNPESRKRIQQLMRKKENRPWLIGVGAGFVVPGPLGLGVAAVFAMVKWNELFPDDPIDSKESNLNDWKLKSLQFWFVCGLILGGFSHLFGVSKIKLEIISTSES